MKRIIIVLTLVVPMLTWGEWEIVEHKGDELKGVTAYRSFSFGNSSENGSGEVVLYDAPDNQIKLICPIAIWDNGQPSETAHKCAEKIY